MKKLLLIVIIVFSTLIVKSQVNIPVKWDYSVKKISETSFELHMICKPQQPWHVYSQYSPNGGPTATKFTFKPNPKVIVKGKPHEVGMVVEKYEKVFKLKVKYFETPVDFVLLVTLKGKENAKFMGTVEYMLCKEGTCIPPQEDEFSFELK